MRRMFMFKKDSDTVPLGSLALTVTGDINIDMLEYGGSQYIELYRNGVYLDLKNISYPVLFEDNKLMYEKFNEYGIGDVTKPILSTDTLNVRFSFGTELEVDDIKTSTIISQTSNISNINIFSTGNVTVTLDVSNLTTEESLSLYVKVKYARSI